MGNGIFTTRRIFKSLYILSNKYLIGIYLLKTIYFYFYLINFSRNYKYPLPHSRSTTKGFEFAFGNFSSFRINLYLEFYYIPHMQELYPVQFQCFYHFRKTSYISWIFIMIYYIVVIPLWGRVIIYLNFNLDYLNPNNLN